MRRSDVVDHAFLDRFDEELDKAKKMSRSALEQAYAAKAAHLSLGSARTDSGDDLNALRLHRYGEIVGKHEGRRSARSESASQAAASKPAPDWHAEAKREAKRLITQGTSKRNVTAILARDTRFSRYTKRAISNAIRSRE